MRVLLAKDEYNSNITPTYFLDASSGVAIDGRTKYEFGTDRSLVIEGAAYDVLVILEDISLRSLEEHASYQEDLSNSQTKARIISDLVQRINERTAFHLEADALQDLSSRQFSGRRHLIRIIYRLAAHVHHARDSSYWEIQNSTLTQRQVSELFARNLVVHGP
jgi:hypothetical protein